MTPTPNGEAYDPPPGACSILNHHQKFQKTHPKHTHTHFPASRTPIIFQGLSQDGTKTSQDSPKTRQDGIRRPYVLKPGEILRARDEAYGLKIRIDPSIWSKRFEAYGPNTGIHPDVWTICFVCLGHFGALCKGVSSFLGLFFSCYSLTRGSLEKADNALEREAPKQTKHMVQTSGWIPVLWYNAEEG